MAFDDSPWTTVVRPQITVVAQPVTVEKRAIAASRKGTRARARGRSRVIGMLIMKTPRAMPKLATHRVEGAQPCPSAPERRSR